MSTDEEPRDKDVAEGGYPEEQHPGAEPAKGTRRREEREEREGDAPGTSSPDDRGPGAATGNPGAAGG